MRSDEVVHILPLLLGILFPLAQNRVFRLIREVFELKDFLLSDGSIR